MLTLNQNMTYINLRNQCLKMVPIRKTTTRAPTRIPNKVTPGTSSIPVREVIKSPKIKFIIFQAKNKIKINIKKYKNIRYAN